MKKSNLEIETDYNDFVSFNTSCKCHSSDHRLSVIVEKEYDTIEMSIFFKVSSYDRYDASFWNKIVNRFKRAFRILFTGDADLEGEFIFRSREHCQDFVNTMQEAINQVESPENSNGDSNVG